MNSILAEFPHLQAARLRSRDTLGAITQTLHDCASHDDRIVTAAVAGSLGRLEQTSGSDVDLIVVVRDDAEDARGAIEFVESRLAPLELRSPKSGGIFSRPLTVRQLRDPTTLGVIDEEMAVFGARMHLLLEARPVFDSDAFASLTQGILNRFADPQHDLNDEFVWRPLLDDLIRYHRSLCSRYRFIDRIEPDRAAELQLKAGYSRFVNVAGLLLLLGESLVADGDPVHWVHEHLDWTPLERIGHILRKYEHTAVRELFEAYDRFLVAMESETLNGDSTMTSEEPRALIEAAGSLKSIVVNFLLDIDRRRIWPHSFLEQLLL